MKKYILMLSASLVMLSSCVSMDMVPKSQGNSESWYSTEMELQMAVNEFYILGYWNALEGSEQWTDNFTYRLINRHESSGAPLDGNLDGQKYYVYHLWEQSYKLISRANSLIVNSSRALANGVSEEIVDRFKAEAYFCRACKYADLVCYFGGVPYVDRLMTIDEARAMKRMNKDEIIPKIYDDFDKAIAGLPEDWGAEAVHATKGAAMAMKARFALYVGDYEVAAKAAKACMDLKLYSLDPDFSNVFLQTTKQIPEKIFVIPRSAEASVVLDQWYVNNGLPRNAGGYGSDNPSWDLLASFLCNDGLPIDESPKFDPRNPFANRDPRCTKTIVEFGTVHCGYEYQPRMDVDKVMNYWTGAMQSNQDNRLVATYASFNGLIWKKGIDDSWLNEEGKKQDNLNETDFIIMRYADVLLMYAEAKIELGEIDQTVLDAINAVRARAYGVDKAATAAYPSVTGSDQATLRKAVRIERRMEFAKEDLRYMDVIRWGLWEKALNRYNYINLDPTECLEKVVNKGLWLWAETPQVDEDGLADFAPLYEKGYCARGALRTFPAHQVLWPIPTYERLQTNNNLDQNPGY